jgi:hypothetical protein
MMYLYHKEDSSISTRQLLHEFTCAFSYYQTPRSFAILHIASSYKYCKSKKALPTLRISSHKFQVLWSRVSGSLIKGGSHGPQNSRVPSRVGLNIEIRFLRSHVKVSDVMVIKAVVILRLPAEALHDCRCEERSHKLQAC